MTHNSRLPLDTRVGLITGMISPDSLTTAQREGYTGGDLPNRDEGLVSAEEVITDLSDDEVDRQAYGYMAGIANQANRTFSPATEKARRPEITIPAPVVASAGALAITGANR